MITNSLFERCFPTKGLTSARHLRKYNLIRQRDELIRALNIFLPKYKINTGARVRAFLSCCGVETDYFKTTAEYASGADYEGRKGLGNTHKGDGRKFKGSGIIQTTGRYNFSRVMIRFVKKLTGVDYTTKPVMLTREATRLGVNFLDHPEMLRDDIKIAVEAACIFWEEQNLNTYADALRIKELNALVNRGDKNKTPLHWEKRRDLYNTLCTIIPNSFSFAEDENGDGEFPALVEEPAPAPAPQDEVKPIDLDKAQVGLSKAQATLQAPAIQTIAKRAGGRLALGLGSVWSTTGGKVATVLTGILILAVAAGIIYSYRKQLQLGVQVAKATFKKAVGGLFA
jgi:putative chitinase